MYVGLDDVRVTLDLDFDQVTVAAEAAIGSVEQQVRARFPMLRRLFIEFGSTPGKQRWSRSDAVRAALET